MLKETLLRSGAMIAGQIGITAVEEINAVAATVGEAMTGTGIVTAIGITTAIGNMTAIGIRIAIGNMTGIGITTTIRIKAFNA